MDPAYLSDLVKTADIARPESPSSGSSLSIDSSYFCKDHTGSGFVLPYASLESSATTSEFGFHPTLDLMEEDISSQEGQRYSTWADDVTM